MSKTFVLRYNKEPKLRLYWDRNCYCDSETVGRILDAIKYARVPEENAIELGKELMEQNLVFRWEIPEMVDTVIDMDSKS